MLDLLLCTSPLTVVTFKQASSQLAIKRCQPTWRPDGVCPVVLLDASVITVPVCLTQPQTLQQAQSDTHLAP